MDTEKMIVYNFSEIADYLVSKNICSKDEAYRYLEAEDKYYDLAGLNVYDMDNADASAMVSNIVIDQNDVERFIAEKTTLNAETVEKISETLYEYMEDYGFFG